MRTPYWTVMVHNSPTLRHQVRCAVQVRKRPVSKNQHSSGSKVFFPGVLLNRCPHVVGVNEVDMNGNIKRHEIFTFRRAPIHQSTIVSVVTLTQRQNGSGAILFVCENERLKKIHVLPPPPHSQWIYMIWTGLYYGVITLAVSGTKTYYDTMQKPFTLVVYGTRTGHLKAIEIQLKHTT